MRQPWLLPVTAAGGGFAAFCIRLIENRTGFESDTGLAIPGNPAATALLALYVALCAAMAVLSVRFPGGREEDFSLRTENRLYLTLPVAGSLLLALAGVADLAEGLGLYTYASRRHAAAELLGEGSVRMSDGALVLCGLLFLATAAGLLSASVVSARDTSEGFPFRGEALLLAPVSLVVRLVAVYRDESVNPVIADCAVELIALAFLVLGFYTLSSFAYHSGRPRHFAFSAGCGTAFSICALADAPEHLSTPLIFLGGSLCLLGFLLLRTGDTAER